MFTLPVQGFSGRANIHGPRTMLALFRFVPGARQAHLDVTAGTPPRAHASKPARYEGS
jgi:hypothetical protein